MQWAAPSRTWVTRSAGSPSTFAMKRWSTRHTSGCSRRTCKYGQLSSWIRSISPCCSTWASKPSSHNNLTNRSSFWSRGNPYSSAEYGALMDAATFENRSATISWDRFSFISLSRRLVNRKYLPGDNSMAFSVKENT